MSNPILTAFNNQFVEFIEDILRLFPGDKDLLLSKNGILTLKKGNPKLLIQIWKQFIADIYLKEIEALEILKTMFLTRLSLGFGKEKQEGITAHALSLLARQKDIRSIQNAVSAKN